VAWVSGRCHRRLPPCAERRLAAPDRGAHHGPGDLAVRVGNRIRCRQAAPILSLVGPLRAEEVHDKTADARRNILRPHVPPSPDGLGNKDYGTAHTAVQRELRGAARAAVASHSTVICRSSPSG
jgi:hypothetical protein